MPGGGERFQKTMPKYMGTCWINGQEDQIKGEPYTVIPNLFHCDGPRPDLPVIEEPSDFKLAQEVPARLVRWFKSTIRRPSSAVPEEAWSAPTQVLDESPNPAVPRCLKLAKAG